MKQTIVKPILIDLLPEDFNNNYPKDEEGYWDSQYNDPLDCPLLRAFIRYFHGKSHLITIYSDEFMIYGKRRNVFDMSLEGGEIKVYVIGDDMVSESITYHYEGWNFEISKRVAACYAQGDTTIYYVPVYRVF